MTLNKNSGHQNKHSWVEQIHESSWYFTGENEDFFFSSIAIFSCPDTKTAGDL